MQCAIGGGDLAESENASLRQPARLADLGAEPAENPSLSTTIFTSELKALVDPYRRRSPARLIAQ